MKSFLLTILLSFLFLFSSELNAQSTYTLLAEVNQCENWIRSVNQGPGDWIMLYQNRGAEIQTGDNSNFGSLTDLNGAGRFEVNRISSRSGDTLFLEYQLKYDYSVNNSVTQVIFRVDMSDEPLTFDLNAPAYDGIIGGVLFLAAEGTLTIDANLNADGAGFAGGQSSLRDSDCGAFTNANDYFYDESNWRGAYKGESLTFPAVLNGREVGRGPNLTGGGGGNDHNAGGGGGGHWQAGGNGAQNEEPGFFNCKGNFPGLGGRGLSSTVSINNNLYFGGGGGAGHGNNPNETAGGNGGGIIVIYAETINLEAAFISANGTAAADVDGDGGGGGGAGGSIVFLSGNVNGDATITARGGQGGSVDNGGNNRCFGPGGGGAGGRVLSQTPLPTSIDFNANPGEGGISQNSVACPNNSNFGITGGNGEANANFEFELTSIQEALGLPESITTPSPICSNSASTINVEGASTCLRSEWFLRTGPGPLDIINLDDDPNYTGVFTPSLTIGSFPPEESSLTFQFRQYVGDTNLVVSVDYTVLLTAAPTADFTFTQDGSTITITSLDLQNVDEFLWFFGDGTNSMDTLPIHTYDTPGTYTIRINVENDCSPTFVEQTVVIEAPDLVADFSIPASTYCVGDTVFLTNLSENAVAYTWSIDNESIQFQPADTSENPFFVLTEAGNFNVVLNAEDAQGMVLSSMSTIGVLPLPDYVLNVLIEELTVNITAVGSGGANGMFILPDGTVVTGDTLVYTSEPGAFEIEYVNSGGPCGEFRQIASFELYRDIIAEIDAPISAGCAPLTTFFFNESSGDYTEVVWSVERQVPGFPDSLDFTGTSLLSSSNDSLLVRFDSAGTYQVQLLVSGPGGTDSITTTVQAELPPMIDFDVAESGGFIQLTNLSTNADSYLWDFGDGNTSTDFQPTHQYQNTGTYDINLNASNQFCGSAASITILVEEIVSVDDPLNDLFRIYPNPSNGILLLESEPCYFEVYNTQGQTVIKRQTKGPGSTILDLTRQPAGLYWLKVEMDGKVWTRKLVVF